MGWFSDVGIRSGSQSVFQFIPELLNVDYLKLFWEKCSIGSWFCVTLKQERDNLFEEYCYEPFKLDLTPVVTVTVCTSAQKLHLNASCVDAVLHSEVGAC